MLHQYTIRQVDDSGPEGQIYSASSGSNHGNAYLVFEASLLLLFSTCVYCTAITKNIKKVVIGSFVRITQFCDECKHKCIWESQPFIGSIPAGNLLTSAAILFSGSIPAKALRIFKILNCFTISRQTFFRHQTNYLQPAVSLVWKHQQETLLEGFKAENKSLVLAGDGRADSPGHSAKYGSYTLIELSNNKVVDFQLVQVHVLQTLH